MNGPRRIRRPGEDSAPLLVVLLLMLLVACGLAYQAWDAARSHQRVTESVLGEYAGFSASELRRRVEAVGTNALSAALLPARLPLPGAPGGGSSGGSELPQFAWGARSALLSCGCGDAASDFFVADLETRAVEVLEPGPVPTLVSWLRSGFLESAREAVPPAPVEEVVRREVSGGRVLIVRQTPPVGRLLWSAPVPTDPDRVVVYTGTEREGASRVYGFVVDVPRFVSALAEVALAGPPLLPLTLTQGARNDELLAATLWVEGRDTVFRVGGVSSDTPAAIDTVALPTGPVIARVAVQPLMAGELVIGGLPRSRLPILLGAIGLTFILLVVALLQIRRQEELFRLRGDFVSGVSHELRTPLAQIRLFSDLLGSGRLEEEQRRRALRILTDEAKRLTYLVENVLRFSRSEREVGRIASRMTEVEPLVREIVEDFAPLARARETEPVLSVAGRVRAPLDPDALRQILLNLLDNAVKYGPRGQRLDVRVSEERGWLRIEVEDEGPGIPLRERQRVWEPYRRLTREVEEATGGSGIGLAVVRDLVALHGGRVAIEDGVRGGCRVVLHFPEVAVAGTPSPTDPAPATTARSVGAPGTEHVA